MLSSQLCRLPNRLLYRKRRLFHSSSDCSRWRVVPSSLSFRNDSDGVTALTTETTPIDKLQSATMDNETKRSTDLSQVEARSIAKDSGADSGADEHLPEASKRTKDQENLSTKDQANDQGLETAAPTKKKKKKPFANLKRKKKEMKLTMDPKRFRRWDGEPGRQAIHEGSFAHPLMQELHNVKVENYHSPTNEQGEHGETKEERQQIVDTDRSNFSKKKMALLLGYLGSKYSGFQINGKQNTIQAQLELALFRSNLISSANFGYPAKYAWSTSGRTDKGVHACAQVCSVKVQMSPSDTPESMLERLNQHLPSDIRVLDLQRTTRNFCAKTQRDRVRYQYLLPSYVLQDSKTVQQLFQRHAPRSKDAGGPTGYNDNVMTPDQVQQFLRDPAVATYRATSSQLDLLQRALQQYVGTKPYHNFTRGMSPGDKTAHRYILSFESYKPFVDSSGMEWIPTLVVGQSFLMNQIRKMVGLAMDVARGFVSLEVMDKALDKTMHMNRIPIAPAQGLFLEMSIYEGYNRRKANDEVNDLDWAREGATTDDDAIRRWREFKESVLWQHIFKEEHLEGNFVRHLYIQEYVHNAKEPYFPKEFQKLKI